MKKYLKFGFISLLTFLFINNVSATATREDMLKMFPSYVIDAWTPEEYTEYSAYDYSKITKKEILIPNNDYCPSGIAPFGGFLETNYKRITLMAMDLNNNDFLVNFTAQWKGMPVRRSFDVIALRFYDVVMYNGTQFGKQYFTRTNGSQDTVNYSYQGTNMVLKDNGYGISMNLVDDSINALELFTSVKTRIVGASPIIYGAYEHAVDNVTLADSQNYDLSSNGMGYVINFWPTVYDHYDLTPGLDINPNDYRAY
ncbi:hypothetical protein [Clostridium sp.]|uniref:hypothetical protein n=1 Tax=Clostridium sp. TaxID=1506 RepID=UPI002FC9EBAC